MVRDNCSLQTSDSGLKLRLHPGKLTWLFPGWSHSQHVRGKTEPERRRRPSVDHTKDRCNPADTSPLYTDRLNPDGYHTARGYRGRLRIDKYIIFTSCLPVWRHKVWVRLTSVTVWSIFVGGGAVLTAWAAEVRFTAACSISWNPLRTLKSTKHTLGSSSINQTPHFPCKHWNISVFFRHRWTANRKKSVQRTESTKASSK